MNIKIVIFSITIILFTSCSSNGINMATDKKTKYTSTTTKGYYPEKKDIFFKKVVSANKNNWCQVLKDAKPKTLIELEDGIYTDYCSIRNRSYITI